MAATTPSTQRPSQSALAPQRASQLVPQTAPTSQRVSQSAPPPPSPLPRTSTTQGAPPQGSPTRRASQSSPSRRGSISKQSASSQPSPPRSRRPSQSSAPPRASQISAQRASKSLEPAPLETQPLAQPLAQPGASQEATPQAQPTTPQDPVVSNSRASQIVLAQPPPTPTLATAVVEPSPLLTNEQTSPASPAKAIESTLQAEESKFQVEKDPERALPFRERPEAKIMRRISLEMRHRMFLMGLRVQYSEEGPVGCDFYVMGEIGKTFVVKLRRFPCCQCGDFLLQRLCKHMMFISLRVFRLQQTDSRIWQQALLPKELNALLEHPLITPPIKPAFRSRLRKQIPVPKPPKVEIPICCPVCFDEIQFFDNEVKIPLGAKRALKPKLNMGTRRKKEDKVKVEEALAEPWAKRTEKFEHLLHCPTEHCQADGCMKIVHEICYLKWNRYKKMSYDLPRICNPNNFYPCAFKCH